MLAAVNYFLMLVRFAFARMRRRYIEDNDEQEPRETDKIRQFYDDPSLVLGSCQLASVICTSCYGFVLWMLLWEIGQILEFVGAFLPLWGLTAASILFASVGLWVYWLITVQIPSGMGLVRPVKELAGHAWTVRAVRLALGRPVKLGLFAVRRFFSFLKIPLTNEAEFTYSEDEIRCLVEESHRGGKLSALENMLIKNSLDFFDLLTQEVMVPRGDMVVLDYNDDMDTMRSSISKAHHTCYPLCVEDKDHIIGFIHVKDFLESCLRGDPNVKRIIRDILVVPEVMPAASLLQLMRTRRIYLAVVVDEYGGTAGMVSLEDLVEELVGEIPQEMDPEPNEILAKPDGTYEFDGTVILDDISEQLHVDFQVADANTIGGYIFSQLERIPKVGDHIRMGQWKFTVMKMQGFRVLRVSAAPVGEENEIGPVS